MNLKEIAQAARVSPSTVSLVLNNKGSVSSQTRERVSAILYENGYRVTPSKTESEQRVIRFLKFSRHSHLVNGNAGFVSAIIDAVEEEALHHGYNLGMTVCGEANFAEVCERIAAHPCDGVILLATEIEPKNLELLRGIQVPLVAVDNMLDLADFSCVDMNNREATFAAVRYLAELGHPRIGYLYNSIPSSNCQARREAFEDALPAHGIPFDSSLVYPLHPTLSGSYESTLRLLEAGMLFPSALVATNDSIAVGAVKAFKQYGLRVPEDISVIGFDDIPFSAISDPPLTTMKVSCKDIGIWAVRLLCEHIDYPHSPPAKIQISPSLVVRNSTSRYHLPLKPGFQSY